MSHFVVYVIGDNIEEQLAPYDENIISEEHPSYLTNLDWTIKSIVETDPDFESSLEGLTELGRNIAVANAWNARWDLLPNNLEYLRADEQGVYELTTYNPDSKWDWYSIGGRWAGELKAKEGREGYRSEHVSWIFGDESPYEEGFYDSLLKGDIDFEGMELAAAEQAAQIWDKYEEDVAAGNATMSKQYLTGAKPNETREEYIERARKNSFVPYAFVLNGQWYERGSMGWFGMSNNEMDMDQWRELFAKTLEDLDDDTLITVVDCHI